MAETWIARLETARALAIMQRSRRRHHHDQLFLLSVQRNTVKRIYYFFARAHLNVLIYHFGSDSIYVRGVEYVDEQSDVQKIK